MFEVGFSELLLIFALALIVLGPERLPRVAAQVGRWLGRARSIARQFREQLEEEINLEEQKASRPKAAPASTAGPASPPETPPEPDQRYTNVPYADANVPYADAPATVAESTVTPADTPAAGGVTEPETPSHGSAAALPPEPAAAVTGLETDPNRAAHERGI
jgi:sec-independent protein translocase protein TatB